MSKVPLRVVVGEVNGVWSRTLLVLVAALLLEVCQLVSPLMLRLVVDKVVFHESSRLIIELCCLFLVFGLLQSVFVAGRGSAILSLSERLNSSWLSNLFDRAMALPISYFENRGVTNVASKFWSVSYMQRMLTAAFLEGVLDGIMAIMAVALVIYLAPTVGGLVVISMVLYALFRGLTYRAQYNADVDKADLALSQQSYLWETISAIQTVRLNLYEARRKNLWFGELGKLFRADFHFQIIESRSRAVLVGITTLTRVAVITVLATGVLDGGMSIGALVAVVAYCEMCMSRGSALVERLVAFKLLDVHRAKVDELVVAPEDPLGRENQRAEGSFPRGGLELIDAKISVGKGHYLVRGANLRVAPGECIGIVGPSGAGKSTLIRAMLGLVPLTDGALLIDGKDIRCINRSEYWEAIGTVLSSDKIFRASVLENVRLASGASEEWVIECVRGVGLHDAIMRLPEGYLTLIKDEDVRLSAGERQRLLIARALCRKPRYLFLDEATSNLDVVSEHLVIEKLRALSVTMILVSHRPSPLSLADRVYQLSGGVLELFQPESSLNPDHAQ